jgi:uncharacterized protein (DUF736 family)
MSNFMPVGGGWNSVSKNGNSFIGLKINITFHPDKHTLTMWPNTNKKPGDRLPDYIVYLAEKSRG